ncbi:MAG: VTT domain-containing protein [Bacteroidota bacterium]|nr:VTT domain-containing protein [Bacteroidota bacterium]
MSRYEKIVLINRYYRITKFYDFLRDTAIKGGLVILLFIVLLLALEYFFFDLNALLNTLVETFSTTTIFVVFLISETFLGLLPPEIFIAWSSKSATPWLFLFSIATLSYVGGIISYFLGQQLYRIPSIKNHIGNKIASHIVNLRKWGGFFVLVGAMLPLPHSMVSLACGLIKYDFKNYLAWALFRYIRFWLYALVIFQVF